MASTKASRKAKRDSSRKEHGSDNESTMKTRKARLSKGLLTKHAVKKSTSKGKECREAVNNMKSMTKKPIAQNGRQPGRQLIRWSAATDQVLLLIMEFELKKHGLAVPYDAIAKRLASEKDTTGACVQQHLAKLRKEMLARGCWVPPLAGKPSTKQDVSDVRGLVMIQTSKGPEMKEVDWHEDAFKYVDVAQLNQPKIGKSKYKASDYNSTGFAAGQVKTKRYSSSIPGDENDPADLPSNDDFEQSNKNRNKFKRFTRSSTKSAEKFNHKSYNTENGDYDDSASDDADKTGTQPVMMALYESEEENQFDGMLILSLPADIAVQFPLGEDKTISAIHTASTDEDGEVVSDNDEAESISTLDEDGAQNSSATMIEDGEYSIMDANTYENYLAAFPGELDEDYSIMDANTTDNYMAAFGNGIGYGNHGHNTDSAFQHMSTPSGNNDVTDYGMFGPSVNTHDPTSVINTWPSEAQDHYRNYLAVNPQAVPSVVHAPPPTAYGQNAVASIAMAPSLFPPGTLLRDVLGARPANMEISHGPAGSNIGFGQTSSMSNSNSSDTRHGFGQQTSAESEYAMEAPNTSAHNPFISDEGEWENEGEGNLDQGGTASIELAEAEGNLFDLDDIDHLEDFVDDYAFEDQGIPEPDFQGYADELDGEYDFGQIFESDY